MLYRWFRRQWIEFESSYTTDELLLKTNPKSLLAPLLVGVLFTLGPAYIDPLSASVQFELPWVSTLLAVAAICTSFAFHKIRGAHPYGPLLTWLDTVLYTAAISWAVGSTAPPASHAYAIMLGIMLSGGQSRDYALSLPFVVAIIGPSMCIVLLRHADAADILITAFSCILAIWISRDTKLKRELARQNEGLRAALMTNDQVIDQSMDIALTSVTVSIGHFLHELRNAQTTVMTNLQFLAECDKVDDEFTEVLSETLTEQERVQRIVEREVDSLRSRVTVRSEAFDLATVLHGVFDDAKLPCTLTPPVRPFYAVGDPDHLAEVLETFVNNAADAGASTLRVRCTIDASNQSATLEVADDGPGISEVALASLFKPFSTHGKKHGTGMGLYLARRRIELMGGSLRGTNSPSAGAVFTLQLPGSIKQPSRRPHANHGG